MDRLVWLRDLLAPSLAPEVLPDLVPALLFILAGSAVAAIVLGDRLGIGVLRTYLWIVCLLLPTAYTLAATTYVGVFGCQMGPLPWESSAALVSQETVANVLLTIPAGAAALLLPSGPRRLAALGCALTLPVTIEFAQMISPPIGRGCQVSDVVNNTAGVLLGFCLAAGVWTVWVSLRSAVRRPTTPGLSSPRPTRDRIS